MECNNVKFYWETGTLDNPIPQNTTPHSIYFVRISDTVKLMYVTNASGVPNLITGGGGGNVNIVSPDGSISVVTTDAGTQLQIAQSVLDTIIKLHNAFPDLQGGDIGEFFHLSEAEHTYLTDIVSEDKIGAIQTALNNLAEPPTYVAPSSSITNITGTHEVGSSLNINITQTFIQNDGGSIISQRITKGGVELEPTGNYNGTLNPVPLGTTVYAGNVTYGQGACKNNNLGLEDCTGRIEPGTTTSANRTITGIYPIFYLLSNTPITAASMQTAISNGTASKLVSVSTSTITVPYAPNAQYFAVAYPATSTTKTRWYVSPLSQGDIPGGVFSAQTTLAINSPTSLWSGVNYKIHVTPLLTNPTAPIIELRNS